MFVWGWILVGFKVLNSRAADARVVHLFRI